jgi:Tol biopolymer transport system component
MRRNSLIAVVVLAFVFMACSARTPTPSSSGTSSGSVTPTASATSTKKPVHVVTARFALYVYQNSIWLYDARTNKTHQVTHAGTVRMPRWLDANHFSFIQGDTSGTANTLRIVDLKTGATSDVFSQDTGINVYGWSPDGQTVAYITTDSDGYPHLRYRSVADGATQSVATLARALGRGTIPSEETLIQYSKAGSFVLVVYTPADGSGSAIPPEQSQFQVRGSDGTLAFSDDTSRDPTMGVFSRDGRMVYFRDSAGVRVWTTTTALTRNLRKLQWFDPSPSPDGSLVAFDTGAESTKVRIRTLNLRALTLLTVSKPGRGYPIFAGPRTVWAQEIVACPACPRAAQPGTRVFAIDTGTLTERLLAIQSIQDADVLYQ